MAARTKRWTRSPRGVVLGVATGLAEWRGFPVDITRLIVFLAILFTGFFPGLLIYLGLAIILPEQTDEDWRSCSGDRSRFRDRERDFEGGYEREWGREWGSGRKDNCEDGPGNDEIYTTFEYSKDKESDWDRRFMDK